MRAFLDSTKHIDIGEDQNAGLDAIQQSRIILAIDEAVANIIEHGFSDAQALAADNLFLDEALAARAYEDNALPIGHGQTISQPFIVALMTAMLELRPHDRVLEIGTGCGYQAALLALLARQVLSIERLKPLHDKARENIAPLRMTNLRLVYGDGMRGHPPNAPYDSIIAAAGGEALPPAWLEQLAVGGRLVAPLQEPRTNRQVLVVVDRHEAGYEHSVHEAVKFVPLKSGLGG